MEDLDFKTGFNEYAVRHPEATASEIRKLTGRKMTRRVASMAQKRALENAGEPTNITKLVQTNQHNLIAHEGEDILVFAANPTLAYISTTPLIFADGTFECVLPDYSQLYIIHAVIANNVAVPTLFFLVKGKCKQTYKTMLRLIEGAAEEDGTTFFDRPVTLMCDFEDGFIKVIEELFSSVVVKCCLFHFTQNIARKTRTIIKKTKKTAG